MLFAVSAAEGVWGQAAGRSDVVSGGGATMMMSPAVVASWYTARRKGQPEELQLLVLWRGTPGWFLREGGSSVYGRGGFDSLQQETGVHHKRIVQGGVTLLLDFDSAARTAVVHGNRLDLADDNVVFVDAVDSPTGPRVTGRMRIQRAMPGSAGQIGPILKGSPRIMAFLQCDAMPADGRGRAMLERLCLQNIGIVSK